VSLSIAACASHVWAADKPGNSSAADLVTLNFVNADIDGVALAVGEITGKNFVIDPRVKGTINIISSKPMSRGLVYEVFLSALRLQGFAAVEERGMVKILPEADAKLHRGAALDPQDRRTGGDQVQTRIFNLTYESAAQLVPILRPLIAPHNTIAAAQNNNSLIITDYAGNLQRIERIIESLDRPSGADPIVIPLFNASAIDVAQTIERLFVEGATAQAGADPNQRVAVAADARSNSILARSSDPARLARVRQLAAMLDSPTSAGGNIHVVYLKNAEAVKVAETLRAIFSSESTAVRSAPGSPVAAGTAQHAVAAAGTVSGIIQADAATNSIIITAPDAVYNNLRATLEKLDARRAQVYVEALIAEVTSDRAAEFGIQWQDLSGVGKTTATAFGGTNFGTSGQNIVGIAQNPAAAGHGLNIGVVKGVVTIGGQQILNLGLLVRALESDSKANILSTPTLLTLDNEEAKIVVGQNVPFLTGSYTNTGAGSGSTNPFQTIERRDVGLTLRIKPQISEGGTVRLQIYQEVSSVDKTTANPAGVTTNKRAVESTVLVDDGQIVVIGGLIQDSVSDGVEQVPGLGSLPLVGGLFRYKSRARSKTNLMVFLRPTVMRTAQSTDALTSDRYSFIRGEQIKATPSPSLILPDYTSPTLPQISGTPPGPSAEQ